METSRTPIQDRAKHISSPHWQKLAILAFVVMMGSLCPGLGAPIGTQSAIRRAETWLTNHPLFQQQPRRVRELSPFQIPGSDYQVYLLTLDPMGYIVLNSDDRLPFVISFSTDSILSLDESPDNAFRAFLENYLRDAATQLKRPIPEARPLSTSQSTTTADEFIAPLLATAWNQCHPYNLFTPSYPQGHLYYGYRAPTGCTNTAFAQVLNYHRWPVHGMGSHVYNDNEGGMVGLRSVDFSDSYDWDSMAPDYDAYGNTPTVAAEAVAELMWELGVAGESNYEGGSTSASIHKVAEALNRFLYYEPSIAHRSQSSLLSAVSEDLRLGYPSVVSIPGHAIALDGLLTDLGETKFHINYGWGGKNNGWWAADLVPGGAIAYGQTSLTPQLMPFPVKDSVLGMEGSNLEMQWILPKRRQHEAKSLNLYHNALISKPWTSECDSLDEVSSSGWQVLPNGRSGSCWYVGPNRTGRLVLAETFIPTKTTRLEFWQLLKIGSRAFTVEVSTDDGKSYTTLYSVQNLDEHEWRFRAISLKDYAGRSIRIRFNLGSGTSYSDGGVYLDQLSMSSGSFRAWQALSLNVPLSIAPYPSGNSLRNERVDLLNSKNNSTSTGTKNRITTSSSAILGSDSNLLLNQPIHITKMSKLPPGKFIVAAALVDRNGEEHRFSPPFRLQIDHGEPTPEIVIQHPRGSDLVDGKSKRNFGAVPPNKKSAARVFSVKNTGKAQLTGLKLSMTGKDSRDFTMSKLTRSSLTPGATLTFKVYFSPRGVGKRNAVLRLLSNDSDESPFDIAISGLGVRR